jgi:uncharacterized protein involved in outer membrane biogenesis
MAILAHRRPLIVFATLLVALAALVFFWNWDWFIPLAESQARTALGRNVTIGHLHVGLGRELVVTADDVVIANPDGFTQTAPFVTIGALSVHGDVLAFVRHRSIVLPEIAIRQPIVTATQLPDGQANWKFSFPAPKPGQAPTALPQIGALDITDGHAHVVSPLLKTDMNLAIETTPSARAPDEKNGAVKDGELHVTASGTYAGQPITGRFVGGALLSLRDAAAPYPVDLHIANGATHVDLVGSVQDPIKFAGAQLKLNFAGPDMSLLYPLTGIPIPQTPPFHITGALSVAGHTIKFDDFAGQVGSSDLEGNIDVTPGAQRPLVTAALRSRRVDLTDLGGFIGSTPGRRDTPGETPAQRAQTSRAEASPKLLPDTPINLPKLRAVDVKLSYSGAHIEGRSVPFDNIAVDLAINDGEVIVQPLRIGVGTGNIASTIVLSPLAEGMNAKATIDFRRVDLSRLMAATHLFHGAGVIGGSANIDTTGASLAQMLGDGNGGIRLFMTGGDLSALLVDLSGLEFGNALLSALGIPNRATLRCFIGDMTLTHGVLSTKTMALDTSEADVHGTGTINLARETIDYTLRTEATHFTIGTLQTPIDITGTFKDPSIHPAAAPLAARVGAAIGLGILFPPLALLPTIQLGLGENSDCERLVRPH